MLGGIFALDSIAHSHGQLNKAASDADISTTNKFRGRSAVEDAEQDRGGAPGKRYVSGTSTDWTGLDWTDWMDPSVVLCWRDPSRSLALTRLVMTIFQAGWSWTWVVW